MNLKSFFIKAEAHMRTKVNNCLRNNFILPKQREMLKNKNFSIIASNCNGGVVSHDLGVRFNSPTVNLCMSAEDFVKFVSSLEKYLSADLQEDNNNEYPYPVGILGGDITLHFQHYTTYSEAYEKWKTRSERVNFDNLFFMMTDRDNCSEDLIRKFDQLPYKNKLIFTAKEYPDIKSAVYCSEFSENDCVGIMSDFSGRNGRRIYDKYFDFVRWFNEG